MNSTIKRSLLKSLCYRLIIFALDFIIIYLWTRKTDVALGFGLISNLYTTVIYFFHERLWNRISYGKNPDDKII